MADLTSVGVTSGVPSSGTGTVGTINYLTQVGAPISNGSTSAPVTVAITGNASAVTSSMNALVVSISPNSSVRTMTLSSNPTVTLSSNPTVIASSVWTVTLSSNPTVIASSDAAITSISSGTVAIGNAGTIAAVKAANTAPSSADPGLVVSISPNSINANGQALMTGSAPVTIASDQTFAAGGMPVTLRSSANFATIVAGSSAVTSTMSALVVALSTLGAGGSGGSSTVGLSSNPTVILSSNPTVIISSAVQTLWVAGTANSGLLSAAVTLLSTELVSLGSSVMAISANTGNAGKFTSSNTGQALQGEIFLTLTTSATTGAGALFSGWFMTSPDSGVTYETTSFTPLSRSPDFVIPVPTGTLGSSTTYKANGLVTLPALQFKVALQNNMGITIPSSASGNPLLLLAPIGTQG
jgi:hypothetical protein